MGTIIERRRKDGTLTYFAQIMRRNGGKMHRESKTFERRQAARIWIEKREKELDAPGGLDAARVGDPNLAEAIERYIVESKRAMGGQRSKSCGPSRDSRSPKCGAQKSRATTSLNWPAS